MARLIDADALKIAFKMREMADIDMYGGCHIAECFQGYEANEIVDKMPTVSAVEVKHGRWIMGVDEADYDYGVCSVCGFAEREHIPCLYIPNYCPNCGAKMDGDGNGNP